MDRVTKLAKDILLFLSAAILLIGAGVEFFNVASGTGSAVGAFSPTWFLLFSVFVLFCLAVLALLFLWQFGTLSSIFAKLPAYRNGLNNWRWAFAILALIFPVWFLQYTQWGIVFQSFFIRFLIWSAVVVIFAFLASKGGELLGWKEILAAFALTSAAFTIAIALQNVTSYPFSLGWSEGNRLWDYSTLFGKSIYNFPEKNTIYVLLDTRRLWVGGLPFLIPGLTIEMARLWVGLTMVIPYFLVGIAAFRILNKDNRGWFYVILWIFLFLKQGPIHAPLVLAAALTVLVWRRSLWIAIPLIIYTGYYAQAGRFTWLFAPGLWIGMLELAGASLHNGKLIASQWTRAIALGFSGVFGGYLLPKVIPFLERPITDVTDIGGQIASSGVSSEFIAGAVSDQPLLWYRLLPNSTYGNGILIGLLIAVVPLLTILFWLVITKKWTLNGWQKLAIFAPLLAFLTVGLIASTKIGGGGDLHNMDMFLIGLAFTAIIAWYNGGREAILDPSQLPVWVKIIVIAALVIPALGPWRQMRSFNYGDQAASLVVLTDASDEKSLDLLPSEEKVNKALEKIQDAVAVATEDGEVLFLDQRQLLTFGYIKDVPLVVDYEKKVLMNQALSGNAEYFQPFYKDLSAHRFSLIVSEKLFTPIKDSSFEFGEENNAWVTWVARPLLCYYQETSTLKDVGVQLFIPRGNPGGLSIALKMSDGKIPLKQKLMETFNKHEWLLPLFLCLLFLAVSLPGVGWGAPALWNPDELIWRVDSALRGEIIFDVSEPDFNYPSLPKYVMYAIGSLVFATGRSSFAFIVAARSFSCLLGALTGVLIYVMSRMIGANKRISLLAGLLYIASGVAAANGRFAHNDLYLQVFSVLCVFFIIKYQYTRSMKWLYASFFCVGLAASSKYTGGSLILLPVAVYIVANWMKIRTRWLPMIGILFLGGVISLLGYGLGTPKALFAPIYYFSNVIPALRNYPQYGFNSGARIGLFGQWAVFEGAIGTFAYYVFILAFLWFAIRLILSKTGKIPFENKKEQGVGIFMTAVLIFDLPFMVSINYIGRYFIPFVPFLAILGAFLIDEIVDFAKRRNLNFVPPLMTASIVVGISYSLLRLMSVALLFENDARISASEYIATMRGYQKSMEYTLYPPLINKKQFERAHNYPIYFVKYPTDVVPTGGRYEYNLGEQGLLERDTDYFVIDTLTYDRFYTESICGTNPVECDFFKKLLAGEVTTFRLLKEFTYSLPPYLPQVSLSAVNPEIRIYERVR